MRINHNLTALNTYGRVIYNSSHAAKSLEKLSSGYQINKAGDGAAGLAISEKMRGQIRGLNQASRNAQDAISMVQTAEGGASGIHDMLQRSRELAVQAANDTLSDSDRGELQKEIDQILTQIDFTAENTHFNTTLLLNKTGDGSTPFSGISQASLDQLTNRLPGWISDSMSAISNHLGIALPDSPVKRPMSVEYYHDSVSSTGASMGTSDGGASLTLRINLAHAFDGSGNLKPEGQLDTLIAHEMVHAFEFTEMSFSTDGLNTTNEMWFIEGLAMTVQGGSLFANTDHNVNLVNPFDGDYRSAYEAVKVLHEVTDGGINAIINQLENGMTLDQAFNNTTQNHGGTELAASADFADFTTAAGFINWFNTNTGGTVTNYIATSSDFNQGSGAITNGGSKGSNSNLTLDQTISNGTGTVLVDTHFTLTFTNAQSATKSAIQFQIGANSNQSMGFQTKDLRTSTLGISGLSITTSSQANGSISLIDRAVQRVSSARSYFGAIQNRLEHTLANLDAGALNLTESESRIRDVEMAKEMMNFTRNNILAQAAHAMLSQANQQPQGVLQLLK